MAPGPFWHVIAPVEKVNLLRNPSLERTTTDWNDPSVGFFAGRVSSAQAFGAYSMATPGLISGPIIGCTIGPFTAGAGTAYTASIYMKASGESMKIGVGNNADVTAPPTYQGTSAAFTVGGGTWQRYSFSYTEASGGARYFTVLAAAGAINNGTLSMDAAMVEVGSLTTYVDGDQEGAYWTGQRHLSPSVRSGTYRGGGSVVPMQTLGLIIDEEPGVGMPPQEITAQSYALQPGALFQRVRAGERSFTLQATFIGSTMQGLHSARRTVFNQLKIDTVSPQQPTRFWYSGAEGTVAIDAVYAGGGEFTGRQGFSEVTPLRFLANDPYWYATTQEGTSLASSVNLGSTNYAAYRDPLGRWGTMGVNGSSLDGNVFTVAISPGGTVFYGGQFGSAGGTRTRAVAMYLPTTGRWGSLTGGTLGAVTPAVQTLIFAPSGTMFAGGLWDTTAGTTGPNIAQWNGAWGTLGPGTVNNQVLALEYTVFGTLFAGGVFTLAGGTQAPRVAMWTPARWGTLAGGTINSTAYAVESDARGTIYVGGDFTEAGGTAGARFLAEWSGAWGSFIGGTVNTRVYDLAFGPNGIMYVGGVFLTAGGGTTGPIAAWNQTSFTAIGGGLGTSSSGSAQVNRILPLSNGQILASGLFDRANTRAIPDNFAGFNGAAWLPTDINIAASASPVYGLAQANDGTIYIGGGFAGTATAAAVARLVNHGMSEAYPIFTARNTGAGTVRLYQLINTLTGDAIYFDLALLAGEEVTLTTEPGARSFTSDFRGNVFSSVVPGSNIASFRLMPGTNYVSFYADSASVATTFYWTPRSESADGGTVFG